MYAGGSTLPARTFSRGIREGVFALLCNLCGGPLPPLGGPSATVLLSGSAIPKRVVCVYCDHDADLPPRALEMLKLLITRPSVAPPAYLSMGRAWTVLGVGFATVVVTARVRGPHRVARKFEVDDVPWISEAIEINDDPTLTFKSEGEGCVRATIIDTQSKEKHSDWTYLNGGHSYVDFRVGAGRYQFAIDEVVGSSQSKPLEIEMTSTGPSPLPLAVILANLMIWGLVFDLRWSKGFLTKSPRKALILRILLAVSIVACFVELLHPLRKGSTKFEPREVQRPAYCGR